MARAAAGTRRDRRWCPADERGDYAQARAAYRRALDFALAASERQALAATVNIVELDVGERRDRRGAAARPAAGDEPEALRAARDAASSCCHCCSGRCCSRARSTRRVRSAWSSTSSRGASTSRACTGSRRDGAAGCARGSPRRGRPHLRGAETAHVRHGQVQRRPAGERIRASVLEILDRKLGAGWRARSADGAALPGEEEACAMALGAVSPGR